MHSKQVTLKTTCLISHDESNIYKRHFLLAIYKFLPLGYCHFALKYIKIIQYTKINRFTYIRHAEKKNLWLNFMYKCITVIVIFTESFQQISSFPQVQLKVPIL